MKKTLKKRTYNKRRAHIAIAAGVAAFFFVSVLIFAGNNNTTTVTSEDASDQLAASQSSLLKQRDSLIQQLREALGNSADKVLNRILGNSGDNDNDNNSSGSSGDNDSGSDNDTSGGSDGDASGGDDKSDLDSGGDDDGDVGGDTTTVGGVVTTKGVRYTRGDVSGGKTVSLLMDIYEPDAACGNKKRPVVLMIHGGGFQNGSRDTFAYRSIGKYLAERGYVAASIDYRMLGDNPAPNKKFQTTLSESNTEGIPQEMVDTIASAFEDTTEAIDFLEDNADKYCINPKRMALLGDSAGSLTSLAAAYSFDDLRLGRQGIDVVVNFWGSMGDESHMESGEADIITIHGTLDPAAAYTEALEIHEQAQKVGIATELYGIQGAGHGFDAINVFKVKYGGVPLIDHVVDFLNKHL